LPVVKVVDIAVTLMLKELEFHQHESHDLER